MIRKIKKAINVVSISTENAEYMKINIITLNINKTSNKSK